MKPNINNTNNTAYVYGGHTITKDKLQQAIDTYKFEEDIKDYDVLYDILNEAIEGLQPFPLEQANEMQIFRALIARFVYNEYLDTEHTSLQHFVDENLVTIPSSVSQAEQELISIFINKTRGTESNDDFLGVLIRVLSFIYIFTEFAIPPVVFLSAALSIKTTQDLRDFLTKLTSKKKLLKVEDNQMDTIDTVQDAVETKDVDQQLQEANKQVEEALFDAKTIAQAMHQAIEEDIKNINKVTSQVREETSSASSTSESSGGGSSSSSSWGWGDVALTAAGIAIVGIGAYYIASNFLTSTDDDIELLPVREL